MNFIRIAAVFAVALISGCGMKGGIECTTEDKSKWMDQEEFKKSLLDQGYKINEFKVTKGNCYEIYGFDPSEKKVEIYFSPIDGSVIKREDK